MLRELFSFVPIIHFLNGLAEIPYVQVGGQSLGEQSNSEVSPKGETHPRE